MLQTVAETGTQLESKTICVPVSSPPRFSDFSRPVAAPAFQAMDTQLGARHRRRIPTIHRGRARRAFKTNLAACQCGAEALQTPGRPDPPGTPSFDRPQRRQGGPRPPWPTARRSARRAGRDLQAGIRPKPRSAADKTRAFSSICLAIVDMAGFSPGSATFFPKLQTNRSRRDQSKSMPRRRSEVRLEGNRSGSEGTGQSCRLLD